MPTAEPREYVMPEGFGRALRFSVPLLGAVFVIAVIGAFARGPLLVALFLCAAAVAGMAVVIWPGVVVAERVYLSADAMEIVFPLRRRLRIPWREIERIDVSARNRVGGGRPPYDVQVITTSRTEHRFRLLAQLANVEQLCVALKSAG